MTTTLYLAWQAPRSRRWFPVGRLDGDPGTLPFLLHGWCAGSP